MAHEPEKKPLDSASDPGQGRVMIAVTKGQAIPRDIGSVLPPGVCLTGTITASATLSEVCARATLIIIIIIIIIMAHQHTACRH